MTLKILRLRFERFDQLLNKQKRKCFKKNLLLYSSLFEMDARNLNRKFITRIFAY